MNKAKIRQLLECRIAYNAQFLVISVLWAEKYAQIGVQEMGSVLVAFVTATLLQQLHIRVLIAQLLLALDPIFMTLLQVLVYLLVVLVTMLILNQSLASAVIPVAINVEIKLLSVHLVYQHLLILNIIM